MDAFDMADVISKYLGDILITRLYILMMTVSKHLFDSVTCAKITGERRLSNYISAERQIHQSYEFMAIGLVKDSA